MKHQDPQFEDNPDEPMDPLETQAEIRTIVANYEDAIQSCGGPWASIYREYSTIFVESNLDPSHPQTDSDVLLKRYVMCSSFMAARAQLAGNKEIQDKAAQSFSTMAWGAFGYQPLDLMQEHIHCEGLWLRNFKQHGLGGSMSIFRLIVWAILLGVTCGFLYPLLFAR